MHGNPVHGAVPHRAASANRTEVVWNALRSALARIGGGQAALDIVDVGGGTGGAAVRLAELGHSVTVVDPSPDSLAALERRAAESGVQVRALQGETRDLADLIASGSVHLALLHNVLEYVDDPRASLSDVVGIVRPGGAVSLIATNSVAAVVHRALAGHPEEALRILESPDGRWGGTDPMPRRFTAEQVTHLAEQAGLSVEAIRGVRVFADLLPGRILESEPQSARSLADLEKAAAEHPALTGIATQLHLLGNR